MLVGHVAVGFAAKRIAPRVALGTLVVAALAADFLWTIFMLAGIEHVEFRAGEMGAANYLVADNVAYSHSLVTSAIWAVAFGAAYALRHKEWNPAGLLFGIVLSHWPAA